MAIGREKLMEDLIFIVVFSSIKVSRLMILAQ